MPLNTGISARIVIAVSHQLAAEIKELAEEDRRPVSAFIRNLLEDRVKQAKGQKDRMREAQREREAQQQPNQPQEQKADPWHKAAQQDDPPWYQAPNDE